MKFTSTRSRQALSASEVLVKGIAADGGLFVPERFPVLDEDFVKKLTYEEYLDTINKIDFSIRKITEEDFNGFFQQN